MKYLVVYDGYKSSSEWELFHNREDMENTINEKVGEMVISEITDFLESLLIVEGEQIYMTPKKIEWGFSK